MDCNLNISSKHEADYKYYIEEHSLARVATSAIGHTPQGHVVSMAGPTTVLVKVTGEVADIALKEGKLIAINKKTGQIKAGLKVSKLSFSNLESGKALIRGKDGQLRELGFTAQVSWMSAADTARFAAIFKQLLDQQKIDKEKDEDSTILSLSGRVTLGDFNRVTVTSKDAKDDKSNQKTSKQFSTVIDRGKIDYQLNEKEIIQKRNVNFRQQTDIAKQDDVKRDEVGKSEQREDERKAGQTDHPKPVLKRRHRPRAA